MTTQEALELGLVLAELDSQLKARKTLATVEEKNELFRSIKERRAAEKQQKKSKPAANWGPGGKRITEFPPGALEAAIKKRRAEEERIAKLTNPKGVPVIFPSF